MRILLLRMTYDMTIIGGGIVGLATAWQFLREHPEMRVAVVEKENRIGQHQTLRNSGVIHSGIYYKPGSAKAVNCVKGHAMLLDFCNTYQVAYDLCGKIIVATREDQFAVLDDIYQRGLQNGLSGIRMIEASECRNIEPFCAALRGIHVPQAGIIDFHSVAEKLSRLLIEMGADVITGFEVEQIQRRKDLVTLHAAHRKIETRFGINCAGLYADRIARMAGLKPPHQIVPFRGEFYQLTEAARHKVRGLIYPVPDVQFPFLGVHLTKRLDGSIEAGPNAVLAFRREGYRKTDVSLMELLEIIRYNGFRALARRHWRKGMSEMQGSFSKRTFLSRVNELIPSLEMHDLYPNRTGVRAQAIDTNGNLIDDYVILHQDNMLHVCNAPSPAATSCLSIGKYVASLTNEVLTSQ